MSNSDKWDHTGYNELQNEDKMNPLKKQMNNKKNFYTGNF